jgi:2-aminoethylphosphonate transport system ATP-binding protein
MAAGVAALELGRLAHPPAAAPASGIGFDGVTVSYKRTTVLHDLTLQVRPGEITAIIGPSGSGKTTALRAVAGFVRPGAGRVRIGERDVTDLPPHARDIGMVVQNYALFPHMRVDDNVAFGLRARRAPAAQVRDAVRDCLALVGMADYGRRYPRQLSGGQQQRVAIARALAIRPRVLLLDEPLSALDAQIRRTMLDELARLHRELPALTVLYVTHDQTEALTLADSIAIMRDGRLVAHGPSHQLYSEPPNRFAAEFLGRANLLPVVPVGAQGGLATVRLGETKLRARAIEGRMPDGPCLLCVRPHALALGGGDHANALEGVVRGIVWQGDLHSLELDVQGHAVRLVCAPLRDPPRPGDAVRAHFDPDDATLIAERAGV